MYNFTFSCHCLGSCLISQKLTLCLNWLDIDVRMTLWTISYTILVWKKVWQVNKSFPFWACPSIIYVCVWVVHCLCSSNNKVFYICSFSALLWILDRHHDQLAGFAPAVWYIHFICLRAYWTLSWRKVGKFVTPKQKKEICLNSHDFDSSHSPENEGPTKRNRKPKRCCYKQKMQV